MAKKKAFLSSKRKAGSADFKEKRAKVGRRVARRMGETQVDFEARRLHIGEQSILRERAPGLALSSRGLTADEHLVQFGHHNDKQRAAAAEGAAEVAAKHAAEAWRLFPELVAGAGALAADGYVLSGAPARRAGLKLLALGALPAALPGAADATAGAEARRAALAAAAPLLAARLGAAMASFDSAVRADAAGALEGLVVTHADAKARAAVRERAAPVVLPPLAAALRVAPSPRGKSGYRAALLRVACGLLLDSSRSAFSFAPEDDHVAAHQDVAVPKPPVFRAVASFDDASRRLALKDAGAPVPEAPTDAEDAGHVLAERCRELAAEALGRLATAPESAREELMPLACLARRSAAFSSTLKVLAEAPAADDPSLEALLVSCAADAAADISSLNAACSRASQLLGAKGLRATERRGLVRRLLKHGAAGKARATLLEAWGVPHRVLGAADAEVLAGAVAALCRKGDVPGPWLAALAQAAAQSAGADAAAPMEALVEAQRRKAASTRYDGAAAPELQKIVAGAAWRPAAAWLARCARAPAAAVVDAAAAAAASDPARAAALLDALAFRVGADPADAANLGRAARVLLDASSSVVAAGTEVGEARSKAAEAASVFAAAADAAALAARAGAGEAASASLQRLIKAADAARGRAAFKEVHAYETLAIRVAGRAPAPDPGLVALPCLRRLAAAERHNRRADPAALAAAELLAENLDVRAAALAALGSALPKLALLATARALRDPRLLADTGLVAAARAAVAKAAGDETLADARYRVEAEFQLAGL